MCYRFNSGDLSTAASRQIPAATKPEDQGYNASKAASPASPALLYARFRQSSSPYMSNESTAPSTSLSSNLENRPISPGQSFLQIDDSKSDKQPVIKGNLTATAPEKVKPTDQKDSNDSIQRNERQPRAPIPSLTINSGDDP